MKKQAVKQDGLRMILGKGEERKWKLSIYQTVYPAIWMPDFQFYT